MASFIFLLSIKCAGKRGVDDRGRVALYIYTQKEYCLLGSFISQISWAVDGNRMWPKFLEKGNGGIVS